TAGETCRRGPASRCPTRQPSRFPATCGMKSAADARDRGCAVRDVIDELRAALDNILKGTGRKGHYVVADMTKRDDVQRLAQAALERMDRIDILVNNAGTNKPQAIDAITDPAWDEVMEINLTSVMVLTRALVPQMKQHRWGRVIHISSVMAFLSKEGRNIYSATKAALVGFARASALDLGPFGITVNCIAPGPFLTDLPASVLSAAEQQ